MFDEDQLLPLSALQHMIFCSRQCALIHCEGQWVENARTQEGRILHENVDQLSHETRDDLRVARGVPLQSLELGLSGRADVVEFHRVAARGQQVGCRLPKAEGLWRPFPVEYKRGRPKPNRSDEVQLCAQALCLEEMLYTPVRRGALFYARRKGRSEVAFDASLRRLTIDTAKRLHDLIESRITPRAEREPKCRQCSMIDVCLPSATGPRRSASRYLEEILSTALGDLA